MSLLLRRVTLPDGSRGDVRLRGGFVDAVGSDLDGAGAEVVDLAGHVLLPAPAEPHAHLDKAYTADAVPNPAGDLMGAVAGWLAHRPTMRPEDIRDRARAAVRAYVAHGATAIRTHVDVAADLGLTALEAVLSVGAEAAPLCDVQVVAFAGTPLSGVDGEPHRALLREALDAGADAVGACPGLEPDPAAAIAHCLDVAAEHRVPVDLHVDESLEPSPCTLELLAEAVLTTGFPHPVLAGHCVSLGMMPTERVKRLAARVAEARITVACLPQTNLYLQGRGHDGGGPRGLTALRALREAGVTVVAGGDNLCDPFNPLGRGDPLETAALLVLAGHDDPATGYLSVSTEARRALGLPAVAVAPGSPAELLAIRAGSVREAIAAAPAERVVVHAGRIVARTTVRREFAGDR